MAFPAQTPDGGEPTMRKGSYSEELVRLLSQRQHARSVEKEGLLQRQHVESRKLLYSNVRSHSFITWGHSVRRRFALRGSSETLPQSRKVCLGYHHKIVRNASIVVETGLARIPDSALIVIPTPRTKSARKKTKLDWQT